MIGSPANRSRHMPFYRQATWLLCLLIVLIGTITVFANLARHTLRLRQVLELNAGSQAAIAGELTTLQQAVIRLRQEVHEIQREPRRELDELVWSSEAARDSLKRLTGYSQAQLFPPATAAQSADQLHKMAAQLSEIEGLIAALQQPIPIEQRLALLSRLDDRSLMFHSAVDRLLLEQQRALAQALDEARAESRAAGERLLIAGILLLIAGVLLGLIARRSQRQAQEANQRFQLVAASVNSAIYDWDVASNRIVWTDGLTDLFGYDLAEIDPTFEWWMERVHPDDVPRIRAQVERSVAQGQDFTAEYRFRAKNGQYRDVLDRGCVVRSSSRRAVRMVGSILDLTARKRAEEALSAEKERLAVTLSSIGEGVIATDNERRIVLINRVAESLTGWPGQEAIGRPLREVYQVTSDRTRDNHDAGVEDGLTTESFSNLDRQTILIARDGTRRIIADSGAPILDHEGRIIGVVLVFRDITERTLLERQLQQAQKIESIGTLAGGIAHDFNNILTGIIGYVDLALMSLSDESPLWSDLLEIKKQAEHAAALTRQLLTFSRRQPFDPRLVDLNLVISDTEKFLRRVIGEHIDLRLLAAPDLVMVYVDPTQVQQVLMNLCINARDAMPNGGQLTIETRNVIFDEEYCHTHLWARPGSYVELSVSDTGIGMDEETLQHIFEPFFTTKEPGKGTGLGLATVYGIVRRHNGLIQVWSAPSKGTTFKIYLRAAVAQQPVSMETDPELPRGGSETILVTEDEDPVREVIVRTLESLGYSVLTAGDGKSAVELFQAYQEQIDLILLDAVMPRLGGQAVYEILQQRRPDLKFLFISGYNTLQEQPDPRTRIDFLYKPFSPTELARRVREVLDRQSDPVEVKL